MDRSVALLAALGLAAALYFYTEEADAAWWEPGAGDPGSSPDPSWTPEPAADVEPIASYDDETEAEDTLENRVAAFLAVIRDLESNHDYNVLYGGQRFEGYADHPRIRITFYNPRRPGARGVHNDYTTAAGAYQFISTTWDDQARRLGLKDFTPESQDAAAANLLDRLGVIRLLAEGNIDGAFLRASGTWASLPGSTAGQGAKPMTQALSLFDGYLVA